ncbi:GlxA family transcriptional regulator [Vallicoccus soli]|uniref:Helix-turn-helix domain-containing protein n=1 Tax=Vallicoccus soli TaxID=2339232 RepID=A0A3A3Z1J6_9ACTN|nr:helix-turn-helix domain-containing protein [Vallicoccus soli]RJK98119.1 helix-turn-helix domain-containing protein [Vallicoccus soli]
MLRDVAVIALPGVAPFELGTVCEVFGIDRSEHGVQRFDFAVCAVEPGRVPTSMGFALDVATGLERVASADLVAVPAYPFDGGLPEAAAQALRAAVDRGARVLSVCSGAFALGEAGLLDGRRCTTHWAHADELARRFPAADVDPAVLYVEDGPVVTSAGTAAGIDACLHVVRSELGASAARVIARRMVVPPHRDGGQAQYVETPVAPTAAETLEDVLTFMAENLHLDLSVDDLARRAHMSPRTFARRFRAETGTTPLHWLVGQRLLLAQRLLEDGEDPVEVVASRTGFGTAAVLRHHFVKRLGTTPQAYRRTFCRRPA